MKRNSLALLFTGFGFTPIVTAEPVPLAAVRPGKPAVQLLGVREVAPSAVIARGSPNGSIQPFDPFYDPSAPKPSAIGKTDNAMSPPMMSGGFPVNATFDPRMQQQPPSRGVWSTVTNWTNERAKALKSAVAGEPSQLPDARVGQVMPMGQPVMIGAQPFQGVAPSGRMAYAGNPAYRWYGWGTTTPGANPYAPTGEYPQASAQWHAMSGATPGAFPVPVTNPFRPTPGAESPMYAAKPNLPKPIPAVPPPSFAFEVAPPSMPMPKPIAESAPFRYVPPDELPITTSVVPSVPPAATTTDWRSPVGPISAKPKADVSVKPEVDESAWQPVSYTEPIPTGPTTTFIGQTVPTEAKATSTKLLEPATKAGKELTPTERVKLACGPDVTAIEIKKLGTENVIVRFNAPTDAVAERAAKAISELAELKAYTVTFDVVVGGK